jgi:uncharacterized protein YdeI (YjbR/CyaY-like superfamily)
MHSVWLIIYKKDSGISSVIYDEAVDEALCFGWIDSLPKKRDDQSYYVRFSRRNPKSNWSAVNKAKVERLIAEGKMTDSGLAMIDLAKSTGTWDALNQVDQLEIPDDLKFELERYNNALAHFGSFPKSIKRGILEWINNAKKPETRLKRISETALLAENNIRANQFIKK